MFIQQGDVLLKSVDSIPSSAKPIKADPRGLVFAEGEHTGHFHSANSNCAVIMEHENGTRYLSNSEQISISHQEHNVVDVPVGKWEIGIVQEYDYFLEAARNVAD